MKLGVMGGTFDPIHLGHLILAEQARDALGLDRVVFLPAGQPWRKAGRRIAPVADRVAMVMAAVSGDSYFQISLIEAERAGPSYTVDTLAALHSQYGAATDLSFILGEDALFDLPKWREPARIVALARLAVAARSLALTPQPTLPIQGEWAPSVAAERDARSPIPQSAIPDPQLPLGRAGDRTALELALPGVSARIDVISMPRIEISSTDIRARVAAGRSIRYLVPVAVENHIATRRLYRD